MLFNSAVFVFFFLPVALVVFYIIGGTGNRRFAIAWLVAASLFFYGWWNPANLWILVPSVVGNFVVGSWLFRMEAAPAKRRLLLGLAIAANLGVLAWFKYADFFIGNVNATVGTSWPLLHIVIPLAISFHTFQQIAYLVESHRRDAGPYDFLDYCAFVLFFPQLLAGPIVHHREIIPQLTGTRFLRFHPSRLTIGLTIFFIGLFKKTILADGVALYSTPVFTAAEQGSTLTFLEAWGGALSYTLQLYFDFSAYSDMAIGLGYMFGLKLPINFNSPYKATSIIDFWRRWHITLSRFLRNYLYVALGGNRRGPIRRYANLMITMLLGGLWHGAGWTFFLWGGLHGLYLIVNHAWNGLRQWIGWQAGSAGLAGRIAAVACTFLCVVFAWVLFRAESLDGAVAVYHGMLGLNGIILPERFAALPAPLVGLLEAIGCRFSAQSLTFFAGGPQIMMISGLLAICWLAPNTAELLARYRPYLADEAAVSKTPGRLTWRPQAAWAAAVGCVAVLSLLTLFSSHVSEFIYFQF